MKRIVLIFACLILYIRGTAQTELWGMTPYGGQYSAGEIFKTDNSGNNQIIENNFFQSKVLPITQI